MLVAAPDDVAECHGQTGSDPRQTASQERGDDSALNFKHSVDDVCCASLQQGDRDQ